MVIKKDTYISLRRQNDDDDDDYDDDTKDTFQEDLDCYPFLV